MKIRTCLLVAAIAAMGCGSGESGNDASPSIWGRPDTAIVGTGGSTVVIGTGGSMTPITGTGGIVGTGGRTGTGGTTTLTTGGTTTVSTVDASIGTGGNIGIDGSVDINGAGGIVGSDGNIGSGGITDAGGTTDQCGLSPDCLTCLKQYCNSQATDVFGSDYANRNFDGGKCPGIVACSCSEETRDTISDCVQKSDANCVSAFGLLNNCLNAAPCGSACTGKSPGGTGGTIGIDAGGTGGIVGSGGSIGTGGTTTPTSGLACPLGTWTADLGPSGCGDVETIAEITVTQSSLGQYAAAFLANPVYGFDQATGQSHCHSMSGTLSATYSDSNRILTMSGSEPNCPGKAMTLTLTINSDCTQAVTRTVFVGCGICSATAVGCAGGCGSETCVSPAGSAVRSTY